MTAPLPRVRCPACVRTVTAPSAVEHMAKAHGMAPLARSERGLYVGRVRAGVSHDVHYLLDDQLLTATSSTD